MATGAAAEGQDPGSIWRVDYNATVAKDAAMGWQGMGLVLGLNTCVLATALLVFHTCARSTRFSLFRFSSAPHAAKTKARSRSKSKSKSKSKSAASSQPTSNGDGASTAPQTPPPPTPRAPHAFTLAKWAELLWRTPIRGTRVEAMLGPEGTFYLLYQLYAFKFLCALSAMAMLALLPLYLGIGVVAEYAQAVVRSEETGAPFQLPDAASQPPPGPSASASGDAVDAHWWSFVHATIRVVPDGSPYMWVPVGSTYAFTLAFGVFYYKLSQLSRIPRPLASPALGRSSVQAKAMDASAATVVSTVTAAAAIASAAADTTNPTVDPTVDPSVDSATAPSKKPQDADAVEAQRRTQPTSLASASTSGHLIGMQPSPISHRSLFIDRGLPKTLREGRMLYLMDEVFPGYVEDVAVVFDLGEFHALQRRRRAEETQLERARILHERELAGERAPLSLRLLPGSMQLPSLPLVLKQLLCCWREPPFDARARALERRIEALREQERACLARILKENRGAGRAFVVFKSPRLRARFVRRVRNRSITSILARFPEHVQHRLVKNVRELSLTRWHLSAAPEPDDLDWQNVSSPFAKRTLQVLLVNAAILVLLLLFTSPIAVTSAISSSNSYSTNAARSLSDVVARVQRWVQQFSPQMARLMATYVPTLILVMVNAVLLNVLHHAGRIQPLATDSAKERMVLRSASVYLLFNTVFVPSLAFVSIDAVLLYLESDGELLDMLGALFLRNSGIFYVDYVLQRAFLGTAVVLLRASELLKFSWEKPRALTPREHVQAVEAWPFYTGTQAAMQMSMLAVVLLFSTVVPLILPLGALYFGMQHAVDKYSLLRVRRRIQGRGSIARTATHATMVSLLLYQAGMGGYFLIRGTTAQSSSVLVLLMVTYVLALWQYIQDKERAGEAITRGGSYSYLSDQAAAAAAANAPLVSEPLPLVDEAKEDEENEDEQEKQQPEDEADGELAPLLAKSDASAPDASTDSSGDKALRLSDLDGDELDEQQQQQHEAATAAKGSGRGRSGRSDALTLRASESTPLTVFGSFPLSAAGPEADSSDLYREPALRRAVRLSFGPRDVGDYGTWGASAVV